MKKINEQTNNECDIEIFNTVGADASVRLQIKQKHTNKLTSNIPTSNIKPQTSNLKFPTSNTAITLVALIITIIVLLILAGITLNMVIGENGIFAKANNAKNKTEVAQYEEELRMSVLEMQTDSATSGLEFNIDTIRKNLKQKIQELQNTDDIEITSAEESETIEGIYKGYEFTIDEKYVAHMGEKSTGIRILTNIEPTGWTKGPVKVNITIKSNKGLAKIKPESEKEIDVGGKTEYVITKENITQNTTFKYEVTDNQGTTTNKTIEIKNIDTNAPTKCEIEKTENTEEGLKITVNAEDAESEIEKIEYYVSKKDENKYQKYETNPIKLESGTYNIYAIAYDKAGNTKQSSTQNIKIYKTYTGITAQMVANEPSKYYGLKVTDYTSQNGQNDWKIFYSDGEHIFLITGDYINPAEKDRISTETEMTISNYSVYWASAPTFTENIDTTILERFKATEYNINDYKYRLNSRCISKLLNVNNWSNYKDVGDKAENAIGSPTIEMWIDSWNSRYPKDKVYRRADVKNGYCIGKSSNPQLNDRLEAKEMTRKEGYNNKLYYLHTGTNGWNGTSGYWVASPHADSARTLFFVSSNGAVTTYDYSSGAVSARPVVSLNTGVTVNATDEE